MALITNKLAAATALAAAFSMLAGPVSAAELPQPAAVKAYDGEALNVERHRRRYRDNTIGVGDVIAGVVLIGAISAIAGAARDARDRDRYERRYPYPDRDYDPRYRSQADDRGDFGARGIDRAVEMCVDEVGRRSARVESVDNATRTAAGWQVSGQLDNGAPFACSIDNDGRISDVALGDGAIGYEDTGDAYGDDYYAAARADEDYPGEDGRYDTAETPDFEQ